MIIPNFSGKKIYLQWKWRCYGNKLQDRNNEFLAYIGDEPSGYYLGIC